VSHPLSYHFSFIVKDFLEHLVLLGCLFLLKPEMEAGGSRQWGGLPYGYTQLVCPRLSPKRKGCLQALFKVAGCVNKYVSFLDT
jgi:hypothetical protein